jgi:hypothetical protein
MARSFEFTHSRTTGIAAMAETGVAERVFYRFAFEVGCEPNPVRLQHQSPVFCGPQNRLRSERLGEVSSNPMTTCLAQRNEGNASVE